MEFDLLFLVGLAVKMAVTATIVVGASLLAERVGPAIAASIITLPVAVGPAYVILALEHDAGFIAQSALGTFVSNCAGLMFIVTYGLLARSRGPLLCLAAGTLVWAALAVSARLVPWTYASALGANVVAFAVALSVAARLDPGAPTGTRPARRWYDLPVRAGIVALLVASVTTLSHTIGSFFTGVLAIFPVALASMAVILHPRIGGKATGHLLGNAVVPLIGFMVAVSFVYFTAARWNVWLSLAAALAISMVWNFAVWKMRQRNVRKVARSA